MNVSQLIEDIRTTINQTKEPMTDQLVMEIIEDRVFSLDGVSHTSPTELIKLTDRVFATLRKDLDILDKYAKDPEVGEIMVNGKDHIFVERKGIIERVEDSFETVEALEEVIRRLASGVHREINELSPIVDARLKDGSRVNAVYKNIAINGPILTIRKFPETGFVMNDLINMGTLTLECARALEILVVSGYNCFISGGTSSGKTTFLNVLTDYIPTGDRIIVIEDSAELQIRAIENVVRMECKNPNSDGKGQVNMEQLIKTSLRMRPDRIIVGEVRGGEVMDMVQAMNTGHSGSLSTGHGNSVEGMLRRLESMFLQAAHFPMEAIRGQISQAIDIMVHMGRMKDRSRKVLEISEIVGLDRGDFLLNPLFQYSRKEGLARTENLMVNREKLMLEGGDPCGL